MVLPLIARGLGARLLGAGLMSAEEVAAARVGAMSATEMKMGYALRAMISEAGEAEGEQVPEELTIPVSSSAIRSIGWRNDGIITVEFNARGTYTYASDYATFVAFAAAPSKGGFFNQHFR